MVANRAHTARAKLYPIALAGHNPLSHPEEIYDLRVAEVCG